MSFQFFKSYFCLCQFLFQFRQFFFLFLLLLFQLLNQFLDEGGRLFTTTGTDEGPRFVYNENGEQGTAEFDVPQADVSSGFVLKHHYLVNSEGQPIDENGNVVAAPEFAAMFAEPEYYTIDGRTSLYFTDNSWSPYPYYNVETTDEVEGYTRVGFVYNNGEFSTEPTYEAHINYHQSLNNLWIAYESNGSAFVPGDVNGDGQVMTDDALTAMRCALGLINLDARLTWTATVRFQQLMRLRSCALQSVLAEAS